MTARATSAVLCVPPRARERLASRIAAAKSRLRNAINPD
jgi:hypothetical protein